MPQALIVGLVALGASTAVATVVVYAALIVGSLAYSSSQERKGKKKAKDEFNAAQVDRLVNVSSAVSPRELVMGRVRKGGTIIFKGSTGAYQKDFYLVVALAAHEIDAVENYYLNDTLVTLDAEGDVEQAPYVVTSTNTATASTGGGTTVALPANYVPGSVTATQWNWWILYEGQDVAWREGPIGVSVSGLTATTAYANATVTYQVRGVTSNVRITTHLGQAGQTADASLVAAFPAHWSANDTLQGVAYLVARFTYSENSFPSGLPNITARIRGAKLYDPRTGLTAWSENPALMMRHVYSHPKFGKVAPSAAEDARIVVAANACDTSTVWSWGTFGDTSALYKASLVLPYGAPARSGLDDLAQAMGGSWAHMGGELFVKAGVYTAPVLTLTDNDLAVVQRNGAQESQRPIAISVHRERAQKYNTVKVKIWDQAQDYKQVSLTPLVGAALLARDGVELAQEVTFPAIGYAPQALHVAGVMMRDARDPLTVDLPVKLTMYRLEIFDTIAVTLSRYGWSAKTFMVLGRAWNADGSLQLTMKETTAAITQMDAGFAAQGFALNTNLPDPWDVQSVGTLTISSGTSELAMQLDGTVTSRIRISWAQSTDISVLQAGQIEVQYRLASSSGAWASLIVPGDETQGVTADVTDGGIYVIRARAKTKLAVSDWNLQVIHQVLGKTEPPPQFDTFTVMAQPDGTRQYNFGYTGAAPLDWLGAEIRYVSGTTSTPTWDTMTRLQDDKTHYTSSPVELNAPLSGDYTFACKSIDTSGNKSAYLVRSITLPNRRLGDVFDEFYEHTDGWPGTKTGCFIASGHLEATDATTWATLPATWAAWTRWNFAPTSPIYYVTPVRDFGTIIVAQVNSVIVADGTVVQELATSNDGTTWSAWGSASAAFKSRYIKLRLTITATGPYPIPAVYEWGYLINALIKSEYINDLAISGLTGFYRIGTGDIRIPLAQAYAVIKRTSIVIQDSSAGTWAATRIDQTLTYGPRWQFRLNGTLADPSFVDFFIEGY
ncbi:MAG: hypothetical protein JJD98_00230 [Polaromonas sp.]|nr:hypothetical protein [Polaromonas sp.]